MAKQLDSSWNKKKDRIINRKQSKKFLSGLEGVRLFYAWQAMNHEDYFFFILLQCLFSEKWKF